MLFHILTTVTYFCPPYKKQTIYTLSIIYTCIPTCHAPPTPPPSFYYQSLGKIGRVSMYSCEQISGSCPMAERADRALVPLM